MSSIESYRQLCLSQQTELRRVLLRPDEYDQAIQLFLRQHAMLHSARMAQTELWSYEDALLDGMSEAHIRRIPDGREHSVAWLIWHMARCEDITMNLLIAGSPQILFGDDWLEQMGIAMCDTGNAMDRATVVAFSQVIDLRALREYRLAVGRRTQVIVRQLRPSDLKRKVDPVRLQQVMAEGAVVEAAWGIADYWGRRDVAGLLLMPATRHNLVHLNEALQIKRQQRL